MWLGRQAQRPVAHHLKPTASSNSKNTQVNKNSKGFPLTSHRHLNLKPDNLQLCESISTIYPTNLNPVYLMLWTVLHNLLSCCHGQRNDMKRVWSVEALRQCARRKRVTRGTRTSHVEARNRLQEGWVAGGPAWKIPEHELALCVGRAANT